jgi:hypothetical protein
MGPSKSAFEALEPERREEFHETWVAFGEQFREGDEIVHHREYRLTIGPCR